MVRLSGLVEAIGKGLHNASAPVVTRMSVKSLFELRLVDLWCSRGASSLAFAEHHHHLCDKGFALFHGSTAFLQRASRLAVRSFSLMLKLSSRGAIGSVASRTSMERPDLVEDAEDVDRVLRALERRRGWLVDADERKSMLMVLVCCVWLVDVDVDVGEYDLLMVFFLTVR